MQKNSCEIVLVPLPIGENSWEQMDTEYYRNEIGSIKCWVAENARTLRRFLSGLKLDINISELDILELDRDIKQQEIEAFLKENLDKPKIGVCSEAGMPCIADPGNRIVDWAHHRELKVRPLVGPSSLFLTLAASGLNGQSFTFHGYAPLKDDGLKTWLSTLGQNQKYTPAHIFIETPYRTDRLLQWFTKYVPQDYKLCIGYDIHGPNQTIMTKTIANWRKGLPEIGKIPCVFIVGK
jgi:16S rRNA (cytidine1402-2'-O)-methyltransferase